MADNCDARSASGRIEAPKGDEVVGYDRGPDVLLKCSRVTPGAPRQAASGLLAQHFGFDAGAKVVRPYRRTPQAVAVTKVLRAAKPWSAGLSVSAPRSRIMPLLRLLRSGIWPYATSLLPNFRQQGGLNASQVPGSIALIVFLQHRLLRSMTTAAGRRRETRRSFPDGKPAPDSSDATIA